MLPVNDMGMLAGTPVHVEPISSVIAIIRGACAYVCQNTDTLPNIYFTYFNAVFTVQVGHHQVKGIPVFVVHCF